MASIKLGELLIKASVLNESQLRMALSEQRKWGGRLGDVMVRMKLITEDLLVRALAKQLNVPAVNLDAVTSLAPAVRERIPGRMARDLAVVPLQLRDDNRTLVVAMVDPQNLGALDRIRAVCRCRVVPSISSKGAIERAIQRFYGLSPSPQAPVMDGPDELGPEEGSFKILDAQNQTRVKSLEELGLEIPAKPSPKPPPPSMPAPVLATPTGNPLSILAQVEEAQREEVATVRAVVELLIEKGYFTKEEYLAKMRG